MKKESRWFQLYADNPTASNLSVAGGAAKLLSILLLIAAIPCTLLVLLAAVRAASFGGIGSSLWFLLDEFDEELLAAFFLWAATFVCRYVSAVLRSRAQLLAQAGAPQAPAAPAEQDVSTAS